MVHKDPPSDAEKALMREEYPAALTLYRAMEQKAPDESKAGVIRTLIEQDKQVEAEGLAKSWTAEQPNNANAQEAMGEVLLREAQMTESLQAIARAQKIDPCLPRIYLTIGSIWQLTGLFASARRNYEQAHKLGPTDIEIRRTWISTLPRARRIEENAALLKEDGMLSVKTRASLTESLAHAKDYNKNDCRQDHPVVDATIPIRAIMNGPNDREGLALDVLFNGKRRRLEIDTGASGILLSRGAASALGLEREQKIQTGGVGDEGEVATSIAHVASIKIGNLEFKNCPVELLEKSGRLDIDGLIGADVFDRYLVTLDFPGLELRLGPIPKRPDEQAAATPAATAGSDDAEDESSVVHDRYIAPEMKDWTKIYRSGHMLLMPVSIGQTKDILFLVDTGAGLMSISPAAARMVTKIDGDDSIRVSGISGDVKKVYSTRNFTLQFAHLAQKVDTMTAFDTTSISHNVGVEISGFLGAPILNRLALHIDYRDNLVKFDYDPRKDPVH